MSSWTPRTTAPSYTLPYYRGTAFSGGLNECVVIDHRTGFVLPNCVGYTWGRWYEAFGTRPNLSRGDASGWFRYPDGYARSYQPVEGAVACFSGGSYGGHVAVVERIISADRIETSNSAYGGTEFWTEYVDFDGLIWRRPYSGYSFLGFIIPPGVTPPGPGPDPGANTLPIWLIDKIVKNGRRKR